jgi:hypothetical protein
MNVDLKVTGLDQILRKLESFPGEVEKVKERVLKQAGRAIASEAARQTGKGGLGEGQGLKQDRKIAGEVRILFPTKLDGGRIYDMIKAKDEVLANQYYAAFKSGNEKRATAIMRKAGVSRSLDESTHKRMRKSGGVEWDAKPLAVIAPGTQRAYIKKRQKLNGVVKGGWYVAGKSLGGRQRTQANDKTVQTFPSYVRRHGKNAALGGSSFRGGKAARLRIWNSVRHIGEVMTPSAQAAAVAGAERRLAKAFEAELKYLNRRKSR